MEFKLEDFLLEKTPPDRPETHLGCDFQSMARELFGDDFTFNRATIERTITNDGDYFIVSFDFETDVEGVEHG